MYTGTVGVYRHKADYGHSILTVVDYFTHVPNSIIRNGAKV